MKKKKLTRKKKTTKKRNGVKLLFVFSFKKISFSSGFHLKTVFSDTKKYLSFYLRENGSREEGRKKMPFLCNCPL